MRVSIFTCSIHLDITAYILTLVAGFVLIQAFRNNLNYLKAFVRKQQMTKILLIVPRQVTHSIEKYLHTDNDLLWHLLSFNNLVGKIVTALFISMLPTSIWLAILIFQNQEETFMMFLCYLMFLAVLLVIGFLHWFLALFIKIIHRPTSLLITLMFHKNIKLSSKMRIVKKLQQIHSDVRLGFTYASFGLISLSSFGKFVILYAKLLMIGYKNFRN